MSSGNSAPPQASAGQLTPRFHPLSLSGRLLQVTVAISPPAAKGASKGPVFCAHPIGRSPQSNAGFQKVGERGASAAKQKLKPSGSSDWISGRGFDLAQQAGPLVIEFCQLGGFIVYRRSFSSVVCFCWLGRGSLLPEKLPFHCVFKHCICRGAFRLEKTRKQRSAFFENLSARGYGWLR